MASSSEKEFAFSTTVTYSTATPGMTIPVVLPRTGPPPGYNWIKRAAVKNTGTGTSAGDGTGAGTSPGAGAGQPGGGSFDPNQGDATAENQSFLRKYWYYILPLVMFTLFTGAEEPAPEGAGAGAAQGGGVAAVAAGAGAAAGSASANKQRRGKRG